VGYNFNNFVGLWQVKDVAVIKEKLEKGVKRFYLMAV
jgi:hypothetical protein